jgi:hypothetical protein
VISTNRHLLQGWVELSGIKWDANTKTLSGIAKVIGGEPFKIVVANNGAKAVKASASGAQAALAPHQSAADLSVITLMRADNGDTAWEIAYQ